MKQWIILRCSGQHTLKLANSLAEAGFEAWAPSDDDAPITASYVFARLHHLQALLELSRSPSQTYLVWDSERRRMVSHGHPHFRLMPDTLAGKPWAIVSDRHIAPLRELEYKRKPRGAVKAIPVGTPVRLLEGGFAGLDGVVQSVRNKFATVTFAGFPVPVQIGCWLLTEMVDESAAVNVNEGSPEHKQAA